MFFCFLQSTSAERAKMWHRPQVNKDIIKVKIRNIFGKCIIQTPGNSNGHHWYAVFIIVCFLVTQLKDLSQVHTIAYLK